MRAAITSITVLTLSGGEAWAQNVDNVDQGTTHVTIQDAVDAAASSDTLLLVAPAFDETVVVDRDIAIVGDGTTRLSSPGVAVFDLGPGVIFELSQVVLEPTPGDTELRGISAIAGGNIVRLTDATFTTSDPTGVGSAPAIVSRQ